MLSDKQLEKFLNKLSFYNLEELNGILYFNGFSGERIELINLLKEKTNEYLCKKETASELLKDRIDIIDNLEIFNIKELYFLHNLFTEAEFSSSVDMNGVNYYGFNKHYDKAMQKVYKELKKKRTLKKYNFVLLFF